MNETADGPAQTPESGGHRQGGGEGRSPLQASAAFLANWDWQSVTGINQRACARGRAQHGVNSETGAACAAEWEQARQQSLTLGETIDFLRSRHRVAPFLFFNGNTFATIGRELALALFSDLPPVRKREASSAIAHYIAGVLDHESMVAIVEGLWEAVSFTVGDRVTSLRGSVRGTVTAILEDGRLSWRTDTGAEFIALPESLRRDRAAR